MIVKLGIVGGNKNTGHANFDLLGVYMPTRGSGKLGHNEISKDAYADGVWKKVVAAVIVMAPKARLLWAGDNNAKPYERLRERRGGGSRSDAYTPCDQAFNHVLSMAALVPLHKVDWTYVSKKLGKYCYRREQASGAGGDV